MRQNVSMSCLGVKLYQGHDMQGTRQVLLNQVCTLGWSNATRNLLEPFLYMCHWQQMRVPSWAKIILHCSQVFHQAIATRLHQIKKHKHEHMSP